MEMARWSRPSVFHQRLFAVIIRLRWCQTRLAWRGEANGPFPLLCDLERGEVEKNLIHLKCGAAVLGGERVSVQRAPLKEHYVRLECGWWKSNHNYREYYSQLCRAPTFVGVCCRSVKTAIFLIMMWSLPADDAALICTFCIPFVPLILLVFTDL